MSVRALLAVGLILLQQPQDKTPDSSRLPKEPIKDWKYRRTDFRYDPKTKTQVEEITAFIRGKEAIPIDVDKKIFDLRGVNAEYFTTPEKDKLSKKIVVEADSGRYDHAART